MYHVYIYPLHKPYMTANLEHDEKYRVRVVALMGLTGCSQEEAIKAMEDCNRNWVRAIDLAAGGNGTWLDIDGNLVEIPG